VLKKVIRTDLEDRVALDEPATQAILALPRTRRRALWSGMSKLCGSDIFRAKRHLEFFCCATKETDWSAYGVLFAGGCALVVGLIRRQLRIFTVIDRNIVPDEDKITTIIEQSHEYPGGSLWVEITHVVMSKVQYIVWCVVETFEMVKQFRDGRLVEIYPLAGAGKKR